MKYIIISSLIIFLFVGCQVKNDASQKDDYIITVNVQLRQVARNGSVDYCPVVFNTLFIQHFKHRLLMDI